MNNVPIKNVYNMLVYAFEVLKSKEYERLNREDCENIYDLLASLLLCGTQTLIKRGFLKNYVSQTEELTSIRGKVDIGNSVRRLSFHNAKAVCNFDEFNGNILFNQVLKATFLHLTRLPLKANVKRNVSRTLLYFNEIDVINISAVKWDVFVFNRNNAHYDTLLYFCRLICEDAIANQDKGSKEFRILEDNLLPSLFEKFIFAFYKKHLPHSVTFQQQIKWKADNSEMLPKMNVDTVISSDVTKLIIDTKFYSKTLQSNRFSDNQTIISSNLYQIFAYVKNEASWTPEKSVRGMLLYPQVDEPLKRTYVIDGSNIFVQTVNLNQEFNEIKQELFDIYTDVENVLELKTI